MLCKGNRVAQYEFIRAYSSEFGTRWLLKQFGIYPNAYYNYLKDRKKSYRERKANLQKTVSKIYHDNNGTTGYRMIYDIMKLDNRLAQSLPAKSTILKCMQELGIRSIARRTRQYSNGKGESELFPNLVGGRFEPSEPNRIWCTDFTYLSYGGKYVRYNCTIIDLYDRSVIASDNSNLLNANLAVKTLKKALMTHDVPNGLILHSDQGAQFSPKEFVNLCQSNHIQQSMSRAGCPYDNAPMERFFNTLKNEYTYHHVFNSAAQLDQGVYEFIYRKYNWLRPHSYNKGKPPMVARLARS
ncbi:MAG: IS3 family transposase [Lachnospiraceae bacterium]